MSLAVPAAFCCLALSTATSAEGASARQANLNTCVTAIYGNDGILSFENRCPQDAHVLFYANANVYGGLHIARGASESTGYNGTQVAQAGGISMYACPEGSNPVDGNGQSVAKQRGARYFCE
jgi:hypothetical protein